MGAAGLECQELERRGIMLQGEKLEQARIFPCWDRYVRSKYVLEMRLGLLDDQFRNVRLGTLVVLGKLFYRVATSISCAHVTIFVRLWNALRRTCPIRIR